MTPEEEFEIACEKVREDMAIIADGARKIKKFNAKRKRKELFLRWRRKFSTLFHHVVVNVVVYNFILR